MLWIAGVGKGMMVEVKGRLRVLKPSKEMTICKNEG